MSRNRGAGRESHKIEQVKREVRGEGADIGDTAYDNCEDIC